MIRPLPHSIFVKRDEKRLGRTIMLIAHYADYPCTGTITAINPKSDLAKEGYSVGQNIIFKQTYKGVGLKELTKDELIIKDEFVYGKYRYSKDNELIIIPRKEYIFGESIAQEKVSRIYIPDAIKNTKKIFWFKVLSIPIDFKLKYQVFGGDTLTFSAGLRMQCKKIKHDHKEYLFFPVKLLDAKLDKQ